jgi:large subunit ribosomal protein L35
MMPGVRRQVSGFQAPDTGHLTPDTERFTMPKQKSKRALRKRVRLTGTGRLRRYHAYKSHLLTRKPAKRKRRLRKATLVSHADERRLKRLLMA